MIYWGGGQEPVPALVTAHGDLHRAQLKWAAPLNSFQILMKKILNRWQYLGLVNRNSTHDHFWLI